MFRRWRQLWAAAPRQLRFTREGKFLIAIAIAAGLAAINTGNNLLFLGWGLVLSAIVLSGVLSEWTLKILRLRTGVPEDPRVAVAAAVPVELCNESQRLPAYGVEMDVLLQDPKNTEVVITGPYQLRLDAAQQRQLYARFVPSQRGEHRVTRLRSRTSYPFGFFEKSRRYTPHTEVRFWVAPAAVDVSSLGMLLMARLGEEPSRRAGPGDEFFSLRPYRAGDDPRRVSWRRSARTGRWVVVETEAYAAREIRLELSVAGAENTETVEHAIAVTGSLAERLLANGYRVGLVGPGTEVSAGSGARQRILILGALARMEAKAPRPEVFTYSGLARVGLCPSGARPVAGVDATIEIPPPAPDWINSAVAA